MSETELSARAPAPRTRAEAWVAFIAANLLQVRSTPTRGERKIRIQAKGWGLHLFAERYLVNRQACMVRELRTGKLVALPVPTQPHRATVADVEALLEQYAVLETCGELYQQQQEAVAWYGSRPGSITNYICSRFDVHRSDIK